jgi:hypothetical protein
MMGSAAFELIPVTTYQKIVASGSVCGAVQLTVAALGCMAVATTDDGLTCGGDPGWNSRNEAGGP